MKSPASTLCLLVLLFSKAFSQDWSTSIASLVFENCSSCHHEGGMAPFPLMSYEDAVTYGLQIQSAVNAAVMPPWPPDPEYNHFMDERVLAPADIEAIDTWVTGGMPEGDPYLAPDPPVYNGAALMANPDDTVVLPVFTIPNNNNVYWNFVNHSEYTETKFINAIEFLPGNASAIHHVQCLFDSSDVSFLDDIATPAPGFPTSKSTSKSLSAYAGENQGRVTRLPANMGFQIPAQSDFVTNIHYSDGFEGAADSSKIYLKFCTDPQPRAIYSDLVLYHDEPSLLNGPFEIPANTVKTFYLATDVFQQDMSLVGLGAHSHFVCVSWEIFLVAPTGDTTRLLKIPKWDFNWQGAYLLTKVIKIPAGSQAFGKVMMDNTVNNPNNPNNPPIDVEGGPGNSDEMARARFWLMDYQAGDENIIIDSAFYGYTILGEPITPQWSIFPNPAGNYIDVNYGSTTNRNTPIVIYNLMGMVVKKALNQTGSGSIRINLWDLQPGVYIVELRTGSETMRRKLCVQR